MPETQGSPSGSGILDRIVETKQAEVRALLPMARELRACLGDCPPGRDLASALGSGGKVAVMAEVKRRSPGAGPIRPGLVPAEMGRAYEEAGVSAVSVLTDTVYFGGSPSDLAAVRGAISIPVLRKDFVVDALQLVQARVQGADGVLLIARILSEASLRFLHEEAVRLGLTPLVEVHDQEELDRTLAVGAHLIGINNRDLRTFHSSLDVTLQLLAQIPPEAIVVSESGIRGRSDVERLGAAGVNAVLVGEALLRARDPGEAARDLVGCGRLTRAGARGDGGAPVGESGGRDS